MSVGQRSSQLFFLSLTWSTDTEQQKKDFRSDPGKHLAYRKEIETELNKRQNFFMKGSPEQVLARKFSQKSMEDALAAKPELAGKLIPSFDVGCRR